MKHSAEYYIEHLEMEPHVEGGYFKECLLEKKRGICGAAFILCWQRGKCPIFIA